MYVEPCNSSDAAQQWSFVGTSGSTQLLNAGVNKCVDASGNADPAQVNTCDTSASTQHWTLESSGHLQAASGQCLDVYNFNGPDVQLYSCKPAGQQDANQVWKYSNKQLVSQGNGQCLSVRSPTGFSISTFDELGVERCLSNLFGCEGGWAGEPCNTSRPALYSFVPIGTPSTSGPSNYTIVGPNGSPMWNNQQGASGPWPHTRYVSGFSWSGTAGPYEIDLNAG